MPRRVVGRPIPVRRVLGPLVARTPVLEPALRVGSVVARERPPLVRHLVGGRHVEMRGEPAPLVVAHRVDRDRRHLATRAVEHGQAQPGQGKHPLVEIHGRRDEPGLEATDRAGRYADPHGQVPLTEVRQSAHPHDVPTGLAVALGNCSLAHGVRLHSGADSGPGPSPTYPQAATRYGPSRAPRHCCVGCSSDVGGCGVGSGSLRQCCVGCSSDVGGCGGWVWVATSVLRGVQQ